jgi:hypothetical protein
MKPGDIIKLKDLKDEVRPGSLTGMRFYQNLEKLFSNKLGFVLEVHNDESGNPTIKFIVDGRTMTNHAMFFEVISEIR